MKKILILFLFCALFFYGCNKVEEKFEEKNEEEVVVEKDKESAEEVVGMANPAAVKCEQDGGELVKVERNGGEDADCVLLDGTVCPQWDYFRGECGDDNYQFMGNLEDINGGKASGIAKGKFEDKYELKVEFENLEDLEEGFFYEGWVVRKSPLSVISTGELTKENGKWINTYTSSKNLTDYDQYVLTLEPDDNDSKPDKHVLEGDLKRI